VQRARPNPKQRMPHSRYPIPRSDIADLRMLRTSLMPEGLEHVITPAELRAVVAFIQAR